MSPPCFPWCVGYPWWFWCDFVPIWHVFDHLVTLRSRGLFFRVLTCKSMSFLETLGSTCHPWCVGAPKWSKPCTVKSDKKFLSDTQWHVLMWFVCSELYVGPLCHVLVDKNWNLRLYNASLWPRSPRSYTCILRMICSANHTYTHTQIF